MIRSRALFSWRVTRTLFAFGVMAIFGGAARLLLGSSALNWVAISVGVVLLALSTWGPWDSEDSGRNRSVLGFRVRPKLDE
jgi:hypothetical protein